MEARLRSRGQHHAPNGFNLGLQKKGEIELTDRQLEMLRARQRANNKSTHLPQRQQQPPQQRVRKDVGPPGRVGQGPPGKVLRQDPPTSHKVPPVRVENKIAMYQDNWAEQPATTAPTTTWESDSAASSGSSSFTDPTKQFYGQGLKGKAKKLYDDTGASFHESRSEVTSAASGPPLIRKMTSSGTLEKSASGSDDGKARSEASSAASSAAPPLKRTMAALKKTASGREDTKKPRSETSSSLSAPPLKKMMTEKPNNSLSDESKHSIKSENLKTSSQDQVRSRNPPLIDTGEEDKIAKTKQSWKAKAAKRTSGIFGTSRSKASTTQSTDEQQKAFLRKMMQGYSTKGKDSKTKGNGEESGSEASSKVNKTRPSGLFSTRKQSLLSSARSGSSSSSSSHDKAIMRKVLDRAKKKKLASNPRKQNFVKSSSTRMKQLLSPKSRSSDESGNDERSFGEDDARKLRREEARLAKRGLTVTPKAIALKSPVRKMRRSPRNLVENSVSRWSSKPTKSPMHRNEDIPPPASSISAGDTASETLSSRSGEDENLQITGQPALLDQRASASHDSHFSKGSAGSKSEKNQPDSSAAARVAPEQKGVEVGQNQVERTKAQSGLKTNDDIPGDDVEINVSVSSLSRRYEAPSPAIPNVETNRTTPLFSNKFEADPGFYDEEPDGYSEFLETLKSEVATTHSQLWRSFHALFRGKNRYPAPLVQPGREAVSFDDKTKDMVTNISAHIKTKYHVECNPGAQLANDKVVKGQATVKKLFGHQPKGRKDSAGRHSFGSITDDDYESDKENSELQIKQVSSSDSIDDVADNEFEVTLGQHVRKSIGGHGANSTINVARKAEQTQSQSLRRVDKVEATRSSTSMDKIEESNAPASDATPADSDNSLAPSEDSIYNNQNKGGLSEEMSASTSSAHGSKALDKDQTLGGLTEKKSLDAGSVGEKKSAVASLSNVSRGANGAAPLADSTHKDQNKGGVTEKRPEGSSSSYASKRSGTSSSKKRGYQPSKSAESEVSIPWSGVKLRSVTDSAKSDASSSSIPASWTKVKLRRVAKKDDEKTGSGSTTDTQGESSDTSAFHRIIVKKPSAERRLKSKKQITPKESQTPEAPENAVGQSAATPIEIIDVDVGETAAAPIEIIDVSEIDLPPSQAEDKTSNESVVSVEGSVIVSLCNDSDSDSQNEMKVVVGKRGLMKVEANPSDCKAKVIWRLDRDDLKSAMLDMSAFKVKLLLEDAPETRDLDFPSSDQCMRFANALHDLTNAAEDDAGGEVTESEDNSVYIEQLSQEEQKVLEEFRQKKKDGPDMEDFARKRLTVNAEAPQVSKPFSVIDAFGSNLSSPISEISGTSTALSTEHSKIAEPYHKMLRMQVPKEAVRHRMEKDQIDPSIIAFVLGDGSCSVSDCGSSASSSTLSIKEEKEAAAYRRMLKMKVPPEAVQHKMEKDGVSSKIIKAVLGIESEEKQQDSSSEEITLTDAEQSIADSYKKMLKMQIPKEAVEHKMKKDGVDEKIIVSVFGGTLKKEGGSVSTASLSDEEESVASSYRQMLKLKISREAVRHKMKLEGIADNIIASVLGELPKHTPAKTTKKKRVVKAGFHWSPVPSGEKFENSIWAKKKPLIESETAEGAVDISQQVSEHVELFQKKPKGATEPLSKKKKANSETKAMARLIDINRANNVAISLKAFKEFDNKELAQIIEFVDPKQKIRGDRALFMRDLLPAPAEVKAIKNYKGEDDKLVPAEKWFQQIVHIKRIDAKVRVMRTIEAFRGEAEELGASFQMLTKACKQVMGSQKLPDLLELVRQIGNRMNEGRGEEAAGFKLDFLPRLAQTKGSDKKTTALDLVVTIFMAQNQGESLLLLEDLSDCQEAGRIQIADLQAELVSLRGTMQKCEKELESLKKEAAKQDSRPPRPAPKHVGDSKSESAIPNSKPRKPMRSADTQVRTDVSGVHHELFEKRSQFIDNVLKGCEVPKLDIASEGNKSTGATPSVGELLRAVQTKNSDKNETAISPRMSLQASQKAENGGANNPEEVAYCLDSAVGRIDAFLSEAGEIFPQLEAQRDTAVNTCKELSEFFCEPGGEKSAANLLNMLYEFAENLNRVTKKHEERAKAEARQKAKQMRKLQAAKSAPTKPSASLDIKSSASNTATTTDSAGLATSADKKQQAASAAPEERDDQPKSLVLMVNEMLKKAGDKGKEDFMRGVTYSNPDDKTLKMIYDEEQKRKKLPSDDKEAGTSSEERISNDDSTQSEDAAASVDLTKTLSLEYSADSSITHNGGDFRGTVKPITTSKTSAPAPKGGRRQSVADRWTRKMDNDEVVDRLSPVAVRKKDGEGTAELEILAVPSSDTEDAKIEKKRRETYMNRWARPSGVEIAPTPRDLEEESDVGAVMEIKRRTRQRYINRWASKPSSRDNDSDSEVLE